MPVIENTCFSIPATGVPTLAPILVDKLNGLAQYISFRDNDAGRTSSDDACVQRQTGAEQFCEVRLWLVPTQCVSLASVNYITNAMKDRNVSPSYRHP
jgi:hypothetical protein